MNLKSYISFSLFVIGVIIFNSCIESSKQPDMSNNSSTNSSSRNPITEDWYADPEGAVFGDTYWIFPTTSTVYEKQVGFDAFSSKDLRHWKKHSNILDTSNIKWAKQAMWAPSVIEKQGKYYFFFSANDLQRPDGPMWDKNNLLNQSGGIGVAIANQPQGPYSDYLGKPLISEFFNDAQPIDQFVFKDTDGKYYMIYGGWGHCNIGVLNEGFTGFENWEDGSVFKEITPKNYVEGPFMLKRNGIYYFMWSQGGWGNDSYHVAYATSSHILGPYELRGTILQSDTTIATGAGHHSVIQSTQSGQYYIVYHRRPIPNKGRDHRVICVDSLVFNQDGSIVPIKMTR